jgi:hypothetical protein
VVIGAGDRILGVGTRVPGTEESVLEGGAREVLFGGECCHRAEEVLDPLQKCGAVRGVD